ncbi:MAG: beta-ketoacyl-[Desulfovibrionaceae bacterium]|nr:beta-ketoacyl-[acyl-carrier-protein] synthase family protein [Desulfovibrionaceae bacterium]
MQRERVVVTGVGAVSPYGEGVPLLLEGIELGRCALTKRDGCVCGLVPHCDAYKIPRKFRRSMSPMSIMATLAAQEAVGPVLPGRTGVALASTMGSPTELENFFSIYCAQSEELSWVRSTAFFKVMSHTVAANVALALGCTGRTLAPSAACSSAVAALSLGYEAIAFGREERMLCGGADEYHPLTTMTFERIGAASHARDPMKSSLPFDRERRGVVCGEGAGVLLLERLESAQERGATILGEIVGCALRSSSGIAQPDAEAISECMREALDDAGLRPSDIDYCNAHATGTEFGDRAEGQAIYAVFGGDVPVNSFKGHLGHTMAASGALESILVLSSLAKGVLFPTLGLRTPDPSLPINLLMGSPQYGKNIRFALKNSFALGGSLACILFANSALCAKS